VLCLCCLGAGIRGSSLTAVDPHESDEYWFTSSSFLQPTSLHIGDARLGPAGVAQVLVCSDSAAYLTLLLTLLIATEHTSATSSYDVLFLLRFCLCFPHIITLLLLLNL
jgi:hypothetical protein